MKSKLTLLGLFGLLALAPAKNYATVSMKTDFINGSSVVLTNPIVYASAGGYVELGQSHKFSLNLINTPGSTFNVKFNVSNSSAGNGIVKKNGQSLPFNVAEELTFGLSYYEFSATQGGFVTLEATVTKVETGEQTNLNFIFIVAENATTFISGSWTNGLPSNGNYAIVNSNYSGPGFSAEELQVSENATFILEENGLLNLSGKIWNYGTMTVEDGGSILQQTSARNEGAITYKRKTTPVRRYDFTYWGSPVTGQTLVGMSPLTLADKYFKWDAVNQAWIVVNGGGETMLPGTGYIVRAPQTYAIEGAGQVYTASFTGVPNNGVVRTPISGVAGGEEAHFNLLSNPYPSALDADLFMNHPTNASLLGGTIYLWSHTTLPAPYSYSADDFAKFNATGGVKTKSLVDGGVVPNGKIGSGQGFMIGGIADGSAYFDNSMRVAENRQFFRSGSNRNSESLEKHRIWIKGSNAQGAYDETLLGYVEDATDGVDRSFDGPYKEASKAFNIYSFIGNDKYVINGKSLPADTEDDIIRIGYKSTIAGQFSIDLEAVDGFFDGIEMPVYLLDASNATTHNLKEGAYSFTTAIGTFDDRFTLMIPFATLSVQHPTLTPNEISLIFTKGNLKALSSTEEIRNISIYDLTGRKVYEQKGIDSKEANIPADFSTGIYVVKAKLDSGVITKKLQF